MKLDMSLISSEDQWSIYAAIASTATLGLSPVNQMRRFKGLDIQLFALIRTYT